LDYTNLADSIKAFIDRYGEKALIILKAIYSLAVDPNIDHRLGDFSYKHLVLKLASMGLNYNPINILRVLEKELGVIEKSYTSSNQTWWRVVDLEALRAVLSEYLGLETSDPKLRALLIKYRSLEPQNTLDWLRRLASKDHLSQADREEFKTFAFNALDKYVGLLLEMERYEEVLAGEIAVIREILSLADIVSSKLDKKRRGDIVIGAPGVINATTRADKLKDTSSVERGPRA